jgi:SAM-dependent methyltransferase
MAAGDAGRSARIEALQYDYEGREKERVDSCNLCGVREHVEVARRDRYGFPAVFCVCERCGLGFLSPRLTAGEYAHFYREVYRPLVSAYHGRRIDAQTVQEEQRGYARELVEFLEPRLERRPESALDIGGSTGVVALAVQEALGARGAVLDPAPDELEVAASSGLETIVGFAEDFDPGERRFDLVLLCQTIDHLLDVSGTLAAIRRLLAPGGRAFVDVLDVEFMLRRRGAIEGAVKIDHPYYLVRATAEAFFARAGLEPRAERLSDDGHWGFLLAPAEVREPDWPALADALQRLLNEIWARRAGAV